MADFIGGDPPASKLISLTRGADKVITLRRKDTDGTTPLDWNASVWIDIDIDKAAPTRLAAAVTNDVAVIRIESTLGDTVRSQAWRIIMSQAGSPSLETPLLVGKFVRSDG
jgi:hypothetical protein